jgi:quinol monooxygenase YgiN
MTIEETIETTLLQLTFTTDDVKGLLAILSKYVVMTRSETGCRNVDLCGSFTDSNKFIIIEKWDSEIAARSHFDSDVMIEMAKNCSDLLTKQPEIDLLEGISAHDLA